MAAFSARIRCLTFFYACTVLSLFGTGDSGADALVVAGRAAETRCAPEEALVCFRKADALHPDDPLILQAISKQLSDEVDGLPSREERLKRAREALEFAEKAEQLGPQQAINALSVAVCYGKIALSGGNRTRIAASREVKKWADLAVQLDPQSDWAEHVLGEWNLELARVSSTERALASLFYGDLPSASVTEAIRHLERATLLGPAVAAHQCALGFAYLENGDKTAARHAFEAGLTLTSADLPDEQAKTKARAALEALQ